MDRESSVTPRTVMLASSPARPAGPGGGRLAPGPPCRAVPGADRAVGGPRGSIAVTCSAMVRPPARSPSLTTLRSDPGRARGGPPDGIAPRALDALERAGLGDPDGPERSLVLVQAVHRLAGLWLVPGARDIDSPKVELARPTTDGELESPPAEEVETPGWTRRLSGPSAECAVEMRPPCRNSASAATGSPSAEPSRASRWMSQPSSNARRHHARSCGPTTKLAPLGGRPEQPFEAGQGRCYRLAGATNPSPVAAGSAERSWRTMTSPSRSAALTRWTPSPSTDR